MRSGARPNARRHGRARHFAFQTAGVDHRAECRLRCVSASRVFLRCVSDQSRRGTGRLARMDCALAARKRNHRRTGDARCRSFAAKPESQLPDRIDALRGAEWVNAEGLHKTKVQQASLLQSTENYQPNTKMRITLEDNQRAALARLIQQRHRLPSTQPKMGAVIEL